MHRDSERPEDLVQSLRSDTEDSFFHRTEHASGDVLWFRNLDWPLRIHVLQRYKLQTQTTPFT